MAIFIFDYPFQQRPSLVIVLFFHSFHSGIDPNREPLHFLDLDVCTTIPAPPPHRHICSFKTFAGVAEFAGVWEDRKGFALQERKNISVEY